MKGAEDGWGNQPNLTLDQESVGLNPGGIQWSCDFEKGSGIESVLYLYLSIFMATPVILWQSKSGAQERIFPNNQGLPIEALTKGNQATPFSFNLNSSFFFDYGLYTVKLRIQ